VIPLAHKESEKSVPKRKKSVPSAFAAASVNRGSRKVRVVPSTFTKALVVGGRVNDGMGFGSWVYLELGMLLVLLERFSGGVMKPGFMSSVCPKQSLPGLVETATSFGYEGIEFRVEWDHGHGIELSASQDQLAASQGLLEDNGIEATCIATGVKINSVEEADHIKARDEMKRYIELAQSVGAVYLRVFGDKVPDEVESERDTALKLAAESCAAVDDHAGQHNVEILIETHTNMRADWAKQIVDDSGGHNVGVLWHIGHHICRGQTVDEAYGHIAAEIRHVHFNVSQDGKADVAENQRTFDLLGAAGYEGYFSVEVINPEDSAAVLKHHIDKYSQFLDAAKG
jgi:sugar phosphate isomerase/epimerase